MMKIYVSLVYPRTHCQYLAKISQTGYFKLHECTIIVLYETMIARFHIATV